MLPITVEIRGKPEPIDAKRIAYGEYGGVILAYIVTPDNRIATVLKDDILIHWNNLPSETDMKNIDRLIQEGKALEKQDCPKYNGSEVQ